MSRPRSSSSVFESMAVGIGGAEAGARRRGEGGGGRGRTNGTGAQNICGRKGYLFSCSNGSIYDLKCFILKTSKMHMQHSK